MTTPAAALPNAALVKNDFGDWLSPMLVKELRQGVRTRVFVLMFILLQVLLLVNISLSLLVASVQEDTSAGSVFFWLTVSFPVLIVLPLNALGTLGNEIKTNTLELTFLTRLTASRILLGKWFAIFTQTLLLVCAVLPYLVLRYFIGGINVSNELVKLGVLLALSAVLIAGAAGVSGFPPRIVRTIAGAFCVLAFFFGISSLSYFFGGSSVLGLSLGTTETIGAFICGLILLMMMLEIGAGRIAPPAENHSAMLRLLAYGLLAVAAVAHFLDRSTLFVTIPAFVIAAGVCAIAVCEKPRHILSIFRPFAARGYAGRALGKLLYPGWPFGVLFTLTIFSGFGLLMASQKIFTEPDHAVEYVAVLGSLLFPVAFIRLVLPRTKHPIVVFFGVQLFCAILTIFCAVCDGALRTNFKDFSAVLPLCTLLLSIGESASDTAGRMSLAGFTTLASLVVALAVGRRQIAEVQREETESLQLAAPANHAPVA